MHIKCTKQCARSSFILQILMCIITRFCCFISLLFSVSKIQGFSHHDQPFSTFFHVFILLNRDKVLKTIFNIGYTRYLIKDLLYNQSTILDWSGDGSWNKSVNFISFKKCNICTTSLNWMICCISIFFAFLDIC